MKVTAVGRLTRDCEGEGALRITISLLAAATLNCLADGRGAGCRQPQANQLQH